MLTYRKYFSTLNEGEKGKRKYKKRVDVNIIYTPIFQTKR